MTTRVRKATLVLFVITLAAASFGSTDAWQRFSSSTLFSVMYPGTWFRIGTSTDRLQLLSSKGGSEGIVIKRGQAEITALEAEGPQSKTLEQVINYYTKGSSVLSQRSISSLPDTRGCSDIKEVVSNEEPIPSADSSIGMAHIMNTDLFCELSGHKIVILLRNWEGDDRQEEYQRVALRMATSIRLKSKGSHT
jgi:hypothetical protein